MLTATKVQLWATTCEDQPGGVSSKLEPLAKDGADLELLIARRLDSEPGRGVIFLSALSGPRQIAGADKTGFRIPPQIWGVRLKGANEPGLGYRVARALAAQRISFRAFTAMAIANEFMGFLAFDSEEDAARAARILNAPL